MRNFLICILLLLLPAAVYPSGPAPLVREHLIEAPVFGSRAFLLEAGRGNSPGLLLVHGLGDLASGTWERLIPELARDYHVLAVDLPGFGRSEKPNALYSPENYALFLRGVVERYLDGPPIIVGHSLGGAVALRYAAAYPQGVRKLVVIDAAGILHRTVITRDMIAPNLGERWRFPFGLDRLDHWIEGALTRLPELPVDLDQVLASDLLRQKLLAGDPARIAGLALVQEDFGPLLDKIRGSAAILWGAEDQVTPLRTGILLEALLPQARLQTIPGAGHAPMLDQPALFARALKTALAQPVVPPSPPAPAAEPVGVCRGESGRTFTGAYERIEISNCSDVRLTRFSARTVSIDRSRVTMDRGEIRGPGTPLRIADSIVTATGLRVEGETALSAAASRLDLAGVTLIGRQAAVSADRPSTLLFSVSRAESPHYRGHLHGRRDVGPGRSL